MPDWLWVKGSRKEVGIRNGTRHAVRWSGRTKRQKMMKKKKKGIIGAAIAGQGRERERERAGINGYAV